MTDQSLNITVSNPTVVVTPAQNSAVTINANDATVVVAESANQLTLSPTAIQTVEVYDPTQGLKFMTNPNNPFLSTATCNATVGNVVSVAGFCAITLRWVTTGDSAHVNIYRATSTNFAHAERIGDSDEEAHTDTVEPGVAYTYWFEPVDYNGTTGPLSLPHSVTSGNNATGFVEALGDLTATHLSPELTNLLNQIIGDSAGAQAALRDGAISDQVIYIDSQYGQLLQFVNQYKAEMDTADSNSLAQLESQSLYFATQTTALAQQLSTLSASVVTDIAAANAAITQEQTTRANEIEAVALTVTTLDSTFSTDLSATDARISSEAGTRANAVEAVAGEVTQLETDFQTDLTSTRSLVTQEASTRSAENLALAQTVTQLTADLSTTENSVNASLSNQDSTLATLDSAVASTQQSLQANYDTLSAGITSEAQARASATSALSGTITSHTTQLGDMSTTVSATAQSVDGIEGEYGVKIDANGRVAGFGLINGSGVAAFDIVADKFSIANPDSPTVKDLYYDSATNTLKFRGQLILSNGANNTYTVSDLSDIQAQDGTDGDDGNDGNDGPPGPPGSPGNPGTAGAGFYRYGVTTTANTWPSNATASSYLAAVAGRPVVQDDVLTIYKTTDLTESGTRRYNGSAWVTAALLIDGDMIATGTIRGDRIVAGSLTVDMAEVTGVLTAAQVSAITVTGNMIEAGALITSPTINGGVITAGTAITSPVITGGVITGSLILSGSTGKVTEAGGSHYGYDLGVTMDISHSSTSATTRATGNIKPYNFGNTIPPSNGLQSPASNLWRYRRQYVTPSITGSVAIENVGGNINSNGIATQTHCTVTIRVLERLGGTLLASKAFNIQSFNSGDDSTKTLNLTGSNGAFSFALSHQYRTETGSDGHTTYHYHRMVPHTMTFTATTSSVQFNDVASYGMIAEVVISNIASSYASVGTRLIRIQDNAENDY